MKRKTTKVAASAASKSTSSKKKSAVLSTCPVNGAGWCPYPFSVAQLAKRLKQKAAQAAEDK